MYVGAETTGVCMSSYDYEVVISMNFYNMHMYTAFFQLCVCSAVYMRVMQYVCVYMVQHLCVA